MILYALEIRGSSEVGELHVDPVVRHRLRNDARAECLLIIHIIFRLCSVHFKEGKLSN